MPSDSSFPLNAEQIVDLIAEAVAGEALDRPRRKDSHMDSPSYRHARVAGVTPKCLREGPSRTVRLPGTDSSTADAVLRRVEGA